jgi:hypothetical protein
MFALTFFVNDAHAVSGAAAASREWDVAVSLPTQRGVQRNPSCVSESNP